jgi:hypothetical protein
MELKVPKAGDGGCRYENVMNCDMKKCVSLCVQENLRASSPLLLSVFHGLRLGLPYIGICT